MVFIIRYKFSLLWNDINIRNRKYVTREVQLMSFTFLNQSFQHPLELSLFFNLMQCWVHGSESLSVRCNALEVTLRYSHAAIIHL